MAGTRMSEEDVASYYQRQGKPVPEALYRPTRDITAILEGVPAISPHKTVVAPEVQEKERHKPNFTEQLYAMRYLEERKRKREIRDYIYEGYILYLADGCRYKPDWAVIHWNGTVELHEIKGAKVWDRDIVRFKVARTQYPWHTFVWAQKKDKGREANFIIQRWAAEIITPPTE
jgi:hypothetical protein